MSMVSDDKGQKQKQLLDWEIIEKIQKSLFNRIKAFFHFSILSWKRSLQLRSKNIFYWHNSTASFALHGKKIHSDIFLSTPLSITIATSLTIPLPLHCLFTWSLVICHCFTLNIVLVLFGLIFFEFNESFSSSLPFKHFLNLQLN